MRKIIVFAFAAVFSTSAVARAELAVQVDGLHTAMNKLTKRLKSSERYERMSCKTDIRAACRYEGGGTGLLAFGDDEKRKASEVTVIFKPDSDVDGKALLRAVTTWGLVMATVDPELTANDRGAVTVALLKVLEDGEAREETKNGIKYTVTISDTIGIWFNASAIDD